MSRYFHDIVIAFESILSNKLRSFLTALGIIFGVAAVISMLAIGKGAQQEILEQIKMVGVNNILITPIVQPKGQDQDSDNGTGNKQKAKFSPGLHLKDVAAIREVLPTVRRISPEIALNSFVVQNGKRASAKLLGVSQNYFDIFNLKLADGTFFNEYQEENGITVCVIGANIAQTFFSKENPIGKYIKFDRVWLRVIGIIQRNNVKITGFESTGINVMNDNIYIPVKTMLLQISKPRTGIITNPDSQQFFRRQFFFYQQQSYTEQRQ